MRAVIVPFALLSALVATLAPGPAKAAEGNDLREFRLGMQVDALPREGYGGFTCADDADQRLQGWQAFRQCAAGPSGLHAVRFRYDEAANPLSKVNDLYEGTKVGGHPVLLTLLIGDDSRVQGLVIETDPKARLYLRKKAFLFGDQVKSRFGSEGWSCTSAEAAGDKEPVGGVFIDEHCEKSTPTRHLTLDRALYRRAGDAMKDFVSRSRLEIREPG